MDKVELSVRPTHFLPFCSGFRSPAPSRPFIISAISRWREGLAARLLLIASFRRSRSFWRVVINSPAAFSAPFSALRLLRVSTILAALRRLEALVAVELLVALAEAKIPATVGTGQRLLLIVAHFLPFFLPFDCAGLALGGRPVFRCSTSFKSASLIM